MKFVVYALIAVAAVALGLWLAYQSVMANARQDPRVLMQLGESTDPNALKILFVGNSFTYQCGLPAMVTALIEEETKVRPKVYQCVAGGFTLERHWESGIASKLLLKAGPWNWVVLQDQSGMPYQNSQEIKNYSSKFQELARQAGAKAVLYETWSDRGHPEQQQAHTDAYRQIAQDLHTGLVPVGEAFWATRAKYPNIDLYDADSHHPSPAGAYLGACMFYSFFTGKPAHALPAQITYKDSGGNSTVLVALPPEQARELQEIADSYRSVKP